MTDACGDASSTLVQGLLRFWHLFPPWMQSPWSVWAVHFLPPVTSGMNAKLRQARPYGLSLTKDMTAKLVWLKEKENRQRPTVSWCVVFGLIKNITLVIKRSLFDAVMSKYDYFSDIVGHFLHPGCTVVHHRSLHFKVSHVCSKKTWFYVSSDIFTSEIENLANKI